MNDSIHLPNLSAYGEKPVTSYWLFSAGALTSVPATSSLQIVTSSQQLPFAGNSFARLISCYASISTNDTSRMIWIDALSLLFTAFDSQGVNLGSIALPVRSAQTLPFNMPALAGSAARFASGAGPERLEIWPAYALTGSTRSAANACLQVIGIFRNTDSVAHSVNCGVGGIIGVA